MEAAFAAAKSGQLELLRDAGSGDKDAGPGGWKKLLAARDEDGRSLIHVAAAAGQTEVLEALVEGAASLAERVPSSAAAFAVNTCDDEGWTPLISAASSGHGACVSVLLGAGANPEAATTGGRTALHYAASKGRAEIARELLKAGASVATTDEVGCTPLHRAASAGQLEVCRLLVAAGAAVDAADRAGQTPVMMAAICAHEEVAKFLIGQGASVESVDKEGHSALSLCPTPELRKALVDAFYGNSEMVVDS